MGKIRDLVQQQLNDGKPPSYCGEQLLQACGMGEQAAVAKFEELVQRVCDRIDDFIPAAVDFGDLSHQVEMIALEGLLLGVTVGIPSGIDACRRNCPVVEPVKEPEYSKPVRSVDVRPGERFKFNDLVHECIDSSSQHISEDSTDEYAMFAVILDRGVLVGFNWNTTVFVEAERAEVLRLYDPKAA